jgi:hypothetical protein
MAAVNAAERREQFTSVAKSGDGFVTLVQQLLGDRERVVLQGLPIA